MYRFFSGRLGTDREKFICQIEPANPLCPYTEPQIGDIVNLPFNANELDKTVWLWSGFTWEELTRLNHKADATQLMRYDLLAHVDVLVDGRYEAKLKDPTLAWRGSSNQRVIDVKASLHNDEIILYKEASNV